MNKHLTWTDAPETLRVSEAAKLTGLHINTVRSAIHDNRLLATKPTNSHWRIQKADLLLFVDNYTSNKIKTPDQIIQRLDKIIELLEVLINGN